MVAVLLSFVQPLEYSSTTTVLATQELGGTDAYTASRSAERIAEDLSNAIDTTSFYDKVFEGGYGISESYFDQDNERKKRKKWSKAIATSVSRSTGLLTIKVYHTDVNQAELLAFAISDVLVHDGWRYTSGGNITVQIVDDPLNSAWPVRPNLLVNAFSGFVLGALAAIGYVLIRVERIRRRHQMVHS
jgi:capsular polysaccharide biosynthesis protein